MNSATRSLIHSINVLEESKKKYQSIKGKNVFDEITDKEIETLDKKIAETQIQIDKLKKPFEQKYNPVIEKIDELNEFLGSAMEKIHNRKMTREEYKRLQHELRLYR
ncbi:MAG: hypothetical protein KatS3mg002_0077 [Candidatus Woesearchaeota archaeon]|nr:MAG: hypothetical protein KatS3mg002_0077 [Candidatus Woesearchaeota archaeon]